MSVSLRYKYSWDHDVVSAYRRCPFRGGWVLNQFDCAIHVN